MPPQEGRDARGVEAFPPGRALRPLQHLAGPRAEAAITLRRARLDETDVVEVEMTTTRVADARALHIFSVGVCRLGGRPAGTRTTGLRSVQNCPSLQRAALPGSHRRRRPFASAARSASRSTASRHQGGVDDRLSAVSAVTTGQSSNSPLRPVTPTNRIGGPNRHPQVASIQRTAARAASDRPDKIRHSVAFAGDRFVFVLATSGRSTLEMAA